MNGVISVLLKAVYFIVVFVLVVFLAYFVSKLLGKRMPLNTGKHMRIVDLLHLGSDRMLLIVQVDKEYLLISSTPKGVGIIKTLEGFSEADTFDSAETTAFSHYLERYRKTYKNGIDVFKGFKNKFSNRDGLDE